MNLTDLLLPYRLVDWIGTTNRLSSLITFRESREISARGVFVIRYWAQNPAIVLCYCFKIKFLLAQLDKNIKKMCGKADKCVIAKD